MGNQRTSIRTLPDGYKVRHYPPDELHPEGMQVMLPGQSPLCERLNSSLSADMATQQDICYAMWDRVEAKQAAQRAAGLPPEKSVV
jgi:hypothetical protein